MGFFERIRHDARPRLTPEAREDAAGRIDDGDRHAEPPEAASERRPSPDRSESVESAKPQLRQATPERERDQRLAPTPLTRDTDAPDELSAAIESVPVGREDQSLEPHDPTLNLAPALPHEMSTDRAGGALGTQPLRPPQELAEPGLDEDPDLAVPTAQRLRERTEGAEPGGASDDEPSSRGDDTASTAPAKPLGSPETATRSLDRDADDRVPELPDRTPAARPEERTVRPPRTESEEDGDGAGEPRSRDDVVERIDTELVRIREELHLAKAQLRELSRRPVPRSSPADVTRPEARRESRAEVRIGQIDVIVEGHSDRKPVVTPPDIGYASRAYLRRL